MSRPTRSGYRKRYDPLFAFWRTSFAGQPKLTSTTLTRNSRASFAPHPGQRVRIVIPNLHRQRPRLAIDPPKPVRQLFPPLPLREGPGVRAFSPRVDRQKPPRADHLHRRQPHPAKPPHDLAIRRISKARHRRHQHRRVDSHVTNHERLRHLTLFPGRFGSE